MNNYKKPSRWQKAKWEMQNRAAQLRRAKQQAAARWKGRGGEAAVARRERAEQVKRETKKEAHEAYLRGYKGAKVSAAQRRGREVGAAGFLERPGVKLEHAREKFVGKRRAVHRTHQKRVRYVVRRPKKRRVQRTQVVYVQTPTRRRARPRKPSGPNWGKFLE